MKFLKKIKRFFGIDENEYEQDYEEVEIDIDIEEDNTKQVPKGKTPRLDPQQAKTTFRFPLIADEEMREHGPPEIQGKQQKKSAVFYDEQESTSVKLPSHLHHKTLVYDVEVSGISELLAKRKKSHGKQSIVRVENTSLRTRPKSTVTSDERQFLTNKPLREDTKEINLNPDVQPKFGTGKRFVPSDVPSPVYGFRKPKPIQELIPDLDEKREALNKSSENEQVIRLSEETASQSQLKKDDPLIQDCDTHLSLSEQHVKEKSNDLSIEQNDSIEADHFTPIKDVSVQHLTIENSTVHIEKLHVEPQTLSHLSEDTNEDVLIEEKEERVNIEVTGEKQEEKQTTSGSKLPFNVIMLASDKAKLKKHNDHNKQNNSMQSIVDIHINEQAATVIQDSYNSTSVLVNEENMAIHDKALDGIENQLRVCEEQHDNDTNKEDASTENLHPFEDVNRLIAKAMTEDDEIDDEEFKRNDCLAHESNDIVQSNETTLKEVIENEEKVFYAQDPVNEGILQEYESNNVDVAQNNIQIAHPAVEVTNELNEVRQEQSTSAEQSVFAELAVEETVKPVLTEEPIHIYEKPSMDFLLPAEERTEDWAWLDEQANYLIEALASHQVHAQIESIEQGPAVTQFEITVAQGTKVSKVRNLSDDIKLALAAKDIRIDAPIPGKRTIGIEIPNRVARAVRLSEVTNSERFQQSDSPLEAALGLDLSGKPVTLDLRKMPHGLIAGATGSGKSVCINSILVSLLYKADPHELKLMLIDPKMVELAPFNRIPHLVSPVITDVKAATAALKWAVDEMERRYQLFMHAGVRDITRFNEQAEKAGQYSHKIPYILIVIDELADLMMMSPADVEEAICRIAQKARACGIHLIVATQRPSVDVITGLIKSNIPTRIAFAVSSAVDSRTILDMHGAERLLGRGDMLYLGNGMPAPIRLQGTFVTDDEIEEIIDYVRSQGEPNYLFAHEDLLKKAEIAEEHDELFEEVCRFVYEQGTASTSSIQRRYHIGYNRAARLVELLEKKGFVSEQRGSKPRDVFINESDLERLFN